MAGRTNREILTGGKKYTQKQSKKHGVDEVVFDKDSRQEYLTGFHKRKLQRKKQAQEFHQEQERLARIEERRKTREERKKDFDERLEKFNESMKEINQYVDGEGEEEEEEDEGEEEDDKDLDEKDSKDSNDSNSNSESDDEWNGFNESQKGILHHKQIYQPQSDEETVVTVESVDNPLVANINDISMQARAKANNVDLSRSHEVLDDSIKRAQDYATNMNTGIAKEKARDRVRKKKFRYLTKTERSNNLKKERVKKAKHRAKRMGE